MEEPDRRRDELIRAVESAFDSLEDSGARWQDLPDAEIERLSESLPFLDPPGWRRSLPAYMRWTLKNYERPAAKTVDRTIYMLSPGEAPELKARALERYKTLSGSQAATACRFLRFMCDVAGESRCDARAAREALAYWGRFCT
ncbi:MAG: hypothetical protein HY925_15780 [Elusimicrobia bacterium]|nr:hypothetical protein [Elusimicrobiota bacterium]